VGWVSAVVTGTHALTPFKQRPALVQARGDLHIEQVEKPSALAFFAAAIPAFVYGYFFPSTSGISFSYHLTLCDQYLADNLLVGFPWALCLA